MNHVFPRLLIRDLPFSNKGRTFGFFALTSGACASALTALGILASSTGRTCLDIFPPQCHGGLEETLTDTSSIFNIYFLIFWIILALVGLAYFKYKVIKSDLLK